MTRFDFSFPPSCSAVRAARSIERICKTRGLELAMKTSLASVPASIHWHYKRPRETGTLEITLDRAAHRLWASVQAGRRAPWINAELPPLRLAIEAALRNRR